jgi:hypothetical protein
MNSAQALRAGPIDRKRKRSIADGGHDYRSKVHEWCLALDTGDPRSTGEHPQARAKFRPPSIESTSEIWDGKSERTESDVMGNDYQSSASEYSCSTDFSHASTDRTSNPEEPSVKHKSYTINLPLVFKRGQPRPDPCRKARFEIGIWKDYDAEFYNWRIAETLQGCCYVGEEAVGHVSAKLINRNRLRENWGYWMNQLGPDASFMANEIFDRYGCIKDEFLHHPYRKGTGVFDEELNDGNFLLIETIRVEPEWRRHRIGYFMILTLQSIARIRMKNFAFTICKPEELCGFPESSDRSHAFDTKQIQTIARRNDNIAIKFFRGLPMFFRRLGVSDYFVNIEDIDHLASHIQT